MHKEACSNLCLLRLQAFLQTFHHIDLVLSSFNTEVSFMANEENGAKSFISREISALTVPPQIACYSIISKDEYIFVDLLLTVLLHSIALLRQNHKTGKPLGLTTSQQSLKYQKPLPCSTCLRTV